MEFLLDQIDGLTAAVSSRWFVEGDMPVFGEVSYSLELSSDEAGAPNLGVDAVRVARALDALVARHEVAVVLIQGRDAGRIAGHGLVFDDLKSNGHEDAISRLILREAVVGSFRSRLTSRPQLYKALNVAIATVLLYAPLTGYGDLVLSVAQEVRSEPGSAVAARECLLVIHVSTNDMTTLERLERGLSSIDPGCSVRASVDLDGHVVHVERLPNPRRHR